MVRQSPPLTCMNRYDISSHMIRSLGDYREGAISDDLIEAPSSCTGAVLAQLQGLNSSRGGRSLNSADPLLPQAPLPSS